MNKFEEIIRQIESHVSQKQVVLVGIDGRGGAGKTTLALMIKNRIPQARIITTDDFYDKDREQIDWKLLEQQVLIPLNNKAPAVYREYVGRDNVNRTRTISPEGLVVIEGVYAIHSDVEKYYDLTIWLEEDLETVAKRVLDRDRTVDEKWDTYHRPNEDEYITKDRPSQRAMYVLLTDDY